MLPRVAGLGDARTTGGRSASRRRNVGPGGGQGVDRDGLGARLRHRRGLKEGDDARGRAEHRRARRHRRAGARRALGTTPVVRRSAVVLRARHLHRSHVRTGSRRAVRAARRAVPQQRELQEEQTEQESGETAKHGHAGRGPRRRRTVADHEVICQGTPRRRVLFPVVCRELPTVDPGRQPRKGWSGRPDPSRLSSRRSTGASAY